jgi:hypothetical protein
LFHCIIFVCVQCIAEELFVLGFGFSEIAKARASANKVVCCHFSADGKLLATGGHDKKVWSLRHNYHFTSFRESLNYLPVLCTGYFVVYRFSEA